MHKLSLKGYASLGAAALWLLIALGLRADGSGGADDRNGVRHSHDLQHQSAGESMTCLSG